MGIVEALAPGAGEEISVGDRVAIPWLGFAGGHCRYCNSDRETLCEAQINTGHSIDGGYAVDLEDDKLEMARDLGADHVVKAAEQDPASPPRSRRGRAR